ncbi:hypothetical protein chiPu_0019473 [Chiloscyllium punctatum]|uniref:Uncharacterized protein n=1 Tax=Chiloscyllium punctatum TaxID=137246 RepID=A0A401RRY6_CHIPU|nr:hypothetical protein [Chiloscyllium punctatum]
MYYFRLLAFLYLVYITIFTFCCVYRPLKPRPDNATSERDTTLYVERTLQESYVTYEDRVRLVGEIISVLGAVIIILLESHDILRYGPKEYFGKTALGGPFHVINICYGVLVLAVLPLRLTSTPGETIPMSFALILAWCNLLYFARGFRLTGPFAIMIQKVASTTLLLEHRLPRCLFPRLGICGKKYGLGDRWFLRVDDRNDNAALQIHTYSEEVDAKGCEGGQKKGRTLNKKERWQRPRQGWQMVRHRKMGQNCRDFFNESSTESCLI